MANINELRKYEIEALVQEELYKDDVAETTTPNHFLDEARTIIKKMINENTVEPAKEYDPDEGLDAKMKQTKALTNLISGLVYRTQDIARDADNLDADIVALLTSTQNAAIKSSVTKLFTIWNDVSIEQPEEEKEELSADPTEGEAMDIEIGESIISPQNKEYVVESIEGDIVCLINGGQKSRVDINIAKKWKRK